MAQLLMVAIDLHLGPMCNAFGEIGKVFKALIDIFDTVRLREVTV